MKPKDQKSIDNDAIRKLKAVGSDNPGGQDHIQSQRLVADGPGTEKAQALFKRKGIKTYDHGSDSWGVKSLPKYEED